MAEARLAASDLAVFGFDVTGGHWRPAAHHIALCRALERVEAGEIKRLMVFLPPRHGKPVYNKAMILMGDGTYKALGEIHVGDFVVTHKGRPSRVTAVYDQGMLPCVQVRSRTGKSTIAALDHPFLTPSGWVKAGDLQPGIVLANIAEPNIGVQEYPFEAFRLAGYFVGDGATGSVGHGIGISASITVLDDIERSDIAACSDAMGFSLGKSNRSIVITLTGGVRPWLREIGLAGHTSKTKRVPEFVFRGDSERIGHFIGAYFACDGHINRRGAARKDAAVEFYSVNRPLLQDVQKLLLRIGIQATLSVKRAKYNNFTGGPFESYRLTITSQDDVARFAERVPVYHHKRDVLRQWGVIRQRFDSCLLEDQIVEVEPAGEQPCRCLAVEEDYTFTADDFVVHNSEIVSRIFPAWFLGRNPNREVILAAHTAELAMDFSRAARQNVVELGMPLWGIRLSQESKAVQRWGFRRPLRGGLVAAGVGGPITGRGAHCLPAGTLVETERGPVPIEKLTARAASARVAAYDADTARLIYKEIEAVASRQADGLYRIATARGRVVEATGDHPFFTARGYVRADALAPGDRLVCVVRERARQSCIRLSQAGRERRAQPLLRASVLVQGREQCAPGAVLRSVWFPGTEGAEADMLRQVSGGCPRSEAEGRGGRARVSRVQHAVCEVSPSERLLGEVLFAGVCQSGSFAEDVSQREPEVEARSHPRAPATALGSCFPDDAPAGVGPGRPAVRTLRRGPGRVECPPHQQQPDGQPSQKPCDALRVMPPHTASRRGLRTESDEVVLVERVCGQATVYDLQVAGTHNFFANGICVHNCAIIDDPIKNMAEARSQTYRDHLWEWYRSTLRTRLAPNGAIVICMTRWHADDLPGRLLAAMEVGGEKWEVMNFPARAGVGDALGRSPGQPLWPEWFPEAELSGIEQAVGPYVWAALYEQKPIRDKAGALWNERLIEPFRAPAPPELDRIIVVVDPAGSENPESSETGICVAGAVGEGVNRRGYLLEDLSGHYSPLEWGTLAVDAYKRHKADGIYGETNYGGDMVEATIRGIDPLVPFARVDATRGKKLRADPVVALYQQGRIHHIRPFPELEIQMCNWDGGGKSPDRLDVVVHAFTKLMLEEADGRKDRSVRTMAEMLGRR